MNDQIDSWAAYLRLLGTGLFVLTAIATYRDLVDEEDETLGYFLIRLTVMWAIAIGLYLRNRWVVRFTYGAALSMAAMLWGGAIVFGPALPLPEFLLMSITFSAGGALVFAPTSTLTGYTPFAGGQGYVRSTETGNPYQPPSTLSEDNMDER